MVYQAFFKILVITLISRKKLGGYKIMRYTVTSQTETGIQSLQEAWHSKIDAKFRPWPHKSDTNLPKGDTKPPGGNDP